MITISTPEVPREILIHKELVEPAELSGEAIKQKNFSVQCHYVETKDLRLATIKVIRYRNLEEVTISHEPQEDLGASES